MQFGEKAAMLKEFGEAAIEAMMQQIGQIFAANIRQNDLAFRYEATSIAIVLGETSEKEGLHGSGKAATSLLAQIQLPEKEEPIRFKRRTGRSRGACRIRPRGHCHRSHQSRRTGGSAVSVAQGAAKLCVLGPPRGRRSRRLMRFDLRTGNSEPQWFQIEPLLLCLVR